MSERQQRCQDAGGEHTVPAVGLQGTLEELAQAREGLRSRQGAVGGEVFRLATGRTLARTIVADWLATLAKPRQPLHRQRVELSTRSMADVVVTTPYDDCVRVMPSLCQLGEGVTVVRLARRMALT